VSRVVWLFYHRIREHKYAHPHIIVPILALKCKVFAPTVELLARILPFGVHPRGVSFFVQTLCLGNLLVRADVF